MKLYDAHCRVCGNVEQDIVAASGSTISHVCPRGCGGMMEWAPGVGGTDVKQPFYDPHLGVTVASFRELEKQADAKGAHLVSAQEYESRTYKSNEDRIMMNAPKRREAMNRAFYRLSYGYKD